MPLFGQQALVDHEGVVEIDQVLTLAAHSDSVESWSQVCSAHQMALLEVPFLSEWSFLFGGYDLIETASAHLLVVLLWAGVMESVAADDSWSVVQSSCPFPVLSASDSLSTTIPLPL